MIALTETQIDEIRSHTKHRKDLRDKLISLQTNREQFDQVSVSFSRIGVGKFEMHQGDRGGLLGDMMYAMETHLKEQIGVLTNKLADLGVVVS